MNTLLSRASTLSYKHVFKPILFTQQPDSVHNNFIRSAKIIQRSGAMRSLIHHSWAYENIPALSQIVANIRFTNPVGLSAGFDKNFELLPLLKSIGFGFMEGGSLTLHDCVGNPRPWFYRLPKSKSLVVHAGLANKGVDCIIQTVEAYPAEVYHNFPVNISVAKTNSAEVCRASDAILDYIGSLMRLEEAGIGSMYTLNISCPNTYGGEPFTKPGMLHNLLTATDSLHLSKPLFIKMPVDIPWKDFRKLVDVANKHRVTGLTMSNLAKDRTSPTIKDHLPDSVRGGFSGLPTQAPSDQLIRQTFRAFPGRFTIIGVGGIFSAEDAYRKLRYGADLVELVTGMIFEGPQLIGQINHGLVKLMQQDGFKNISDVIGSAN